MLSTFMGELRLMVGADNLITYSPKLKNIRGYPPIPWSDFINNYPGLSSDHGKVLEDDGLTVVFQKFNRPSSGILEAHGMMLESTNRK